MALFTPTGGLVYHLRARRHRERLWLPFRRAVQGWLEQVLPAGDELILVGPSAGHCLPLAHLSRFQRALVLEPDAIARFLLARRLRVGHLAFETDDLLVRPLLRGGPGLGELLAERPAASVLFCNLLGQLQFGLSDEEQAALRAAFQGRIVPQLAGRRWASFHDRWSLDRDASEPALPQGTHFRRAPDDDELGAALFGAAGPQVTVMDHGTAGLFPTSAPYCYFCWQLTPAALHVVEAVSG